LAVIDRHPRLVREDKTVEAMILMQCRALHHTRDGLCPDCRELLAYARKRLDRCPFQEGKTQCVRCLIHCYKPAMRKKIRIVMRYAGPRMIYRHPLLAIYHIIDGMRKQPRKPMNR
jgi:predicted amidophosphoribosyltransferase